jgi:hypothetical protein
VSEAIYRTESLKCQIQLVNALNAIWDKLDEISENIPEPGR